VSQLFIHTYLDEDVDVLVARLLGTRQFEATTTAEARRLNRSDPEQLEFASQGHMALLTHNRGDFEALAREYILAGRNHAGIFIAIRRSPYEIARRLLLYLDDITADEMMNQVIYF
jgi:hypothetical protein